MTYLPIRDAAARLSMSEEALQTFCRRRARRKGKDVIAELPDGIVAQSRQAWDPVGYDAALQELYRRYPSTEVLLDAARVVCVGGMDR